ncbi:MAG: dihydroorotate dehydrogenase [Nitrososphaerota archaeon]|nr:dihydroorotate dehydrogenase [Nitrososphaerota archaeon]
MERSLRVKVAGLRLENPLLLASGIVGVTVDSLTRAIESGAGGAVSKSIGLEPREGYRNPTLVATDSGLVNAVGLSNPGARVFSEELAAVKGRRLPIVVSIFGGGPAEFGRVVEMLDGNEFLAYELNLSCPHVEGVGTEIGHDPEVAASVVRSVRSRTKKPVFAKLSANTHRMVDVAKAAVDSGADGLTAINTMRAMTIEVETRRPTLSHKFGGLSGTSIRPIAIARIYELYQAFKVPIIGCGGVSTWEHAVEMLLAGASSVEVGTALYNGYGVFSDINQGITNYMVRKRFKKVQEMVGLGHKF